MTAVLPVLFGTPGKPESAGYVAARKFSATPDDENVPGDSKDTGEQP